MSCCLVQFKSASSCVLGHRSSTGNFILPLSDCTQSIVKARHQSHTFSLLSRSFSLCSALTLEPLRHKHLNRHGLLLSGRTHLCLVRIDPFAIRTLLFGHRLMMNKCFVKQPCWNWSLLVVQPLQWPGFRCQCHQSHVHNVSCNPQRLVEFYFI